MCTVFNCWVPAYGLLTLIGSYMSLLVPTRVSTDRNRWLRVILGTDTYAYGQELNCTGTFAYLQ